MGIQGILAFIGALSLLVFVHELGHFLVAKWTGIRVEGFSLFFGRPIFAVRRAHEGGWRFRLLTWEWGLPEEAFAHGETEYAIRWIPFGGYVKMSGQSDFGEAEQTGQPWEFTSKSVAARAAVVFAGPLMNFILAVVIFAYLNHQYGVIGRIGIGPALDMRVASVAPGSRADSLGVLPGSLWVGVNEHPITTWEALGEVLQEDEHVVLMLARPTGDTLRIPLEPKLANLYEFGATWETGPVVGSLIPLEPAGEAGLRVGDRILSVNGEPVSTWTEMSRLIRRYPGQEVMLTIERSGARRVVGLTPAVEIASEGTEGGVRLSIGPAITTAVVQTWVVTVKIVRFFERLVTRAISPKYLAGPIGIFQMAGVAAEKGIATYFLLIANLSADLGFINLLPLALLDGGHLVFFGFEALTRKRPSPRQQGIIQQVSMVLLLALMIFVTLNDLNRLF